MGRGSIKQFLVDAKPAISEHWKSCREARLHGHAVARTREVDRALEAYVEALERARDKPAILTAMRALFARLDEVNEGAGGGLLETDERELLVPVIVDAAAAAGLDVSRFPHRDPTFEFRNF